MHPSWYNTATSEEYLNIEITTWQKHDISRPSKIQPHLSVPSTPSPPGIHRADRNAVGIAQYIQVPTSIKRGSVHILHYRTLLCIDVGGTGTGRAYSRSHATLTSNLPFAWAYQKQKAIMHSAIGLFSYCVLYRAVRCAVIAHLHRYTIGAITGFSVHTVRN